MTIYSETHPTELSKEFCDSMFKEHGLFKPIIDPATSFIKDTTYYFVRVKTCDICNKFDLTKLCVPTRNQEIFKTIYHICYNCHWDLTNYALNPSTIDYCRSVKEDSIENLKKKTTVFNYE